MIVCLSDVDQPCCVCDGGIAVRESCGAVVCRECKVGIHPIPSFRYSENSVHFVLPFGLVFSLLLTRKLPCLLFYVDMHILKHFYML